MRLPLHRGAEPIAKRANSRIGAQVNLFQA